MKVDEIFKTCEQPISFEMFPPKGELSLDVAKESVGIVFGLADDDHEIDEPFGLEHQP